MPAALKVDWTLIKAAYLAGVEPKVIGEKFQVNPFSVYKRAERGNWNTLKEEQAKLVSRSQSQTSVKSSLLSKSVQSISEIMSHNRDEFLKSGGNVIMKASKRLEKIAEEEVDEMGTRELGGVSAVAESLARAAKPIFGLGDDNKIQVGVQVAVLSNLDEIPDVQVDTK